MADPANITDVSCVENQIVDQWIPQFAEYLRCRTVIPGIIPQLADPTAQRGCKLRVSQVVNVVGAKQPKEDCDFTTEKLQMVHADIELKDRVYAAVEFCDIVELISQVNLGNAQVRNRLADAVADQINACAYAAVDCNKEESIGADPLEANFLTKLTKCADQLCWGADRWLVVGPCLKQELLDTCKLTDNDFGASDSPVIGGQFTLRRYGWNIVYDGSSALIDTFGGGEERTGLAFTNGFLWSANGYQNRVKISDLHSNCKWSTLLSIDSLVGFGPGPDSADRCIKIIP